MHRYDCFRLQDDVTSLEGMQALHLRACPQHLALYVASLSQSPTEVVCVADMCLFQACSNVVSDDLERASDRTLAAGVLLVYEARHAMRKCGAITAA